MTADRRALTVLLVAGIVLAACGGGDEPDPEPVVGQIVGEDEATATPAEASAGDAETAVDSGDGVVEEATSAPATLSLTDTDIGPVLADGDGRVVYVFLSDPIGASSCTESCAELWPPFDPAELASDDVDPSRLSYIDRTDGGRQATIDGRPLYYFSGDTGPGQVNGHNSGGVWFAVGRDAQPVG